MPFFIFFRFYLIIPLILLLILFLTTAFFETFWLTTNPNLLWPKPFPATLKIKKPFLRLFPFLKISSKSFFFFILFIFGNILQSQPFSALPSSFLNNLTACFCLFSSQKPMGSGSFFLFWIIC